MKAALRSCTLLQDIFDVNHKSQWFLGIPPYRNPSLGQAFCPQSSLYCDVLLHKEERAGVISGNILVMSPGHFWQAIWECSSPHSAQAKNKFLKIQVLKHKSQKKIKKPQTNKPAKGAVLHQSLHCKNSLVSPNYPFLGHSKYLRCSEYHLLRGFPLLFDLFVPLLSMDSTKAPFFTASASLLG